jgi:benzoate membrane transport protein
MSITTSETSPSAAADNSARLPLQPILAGILAAVVGYASTFTLVLAGLAAAGATAAQAGSGLFSVCIALGVLNIAISWRTRMPVSIAWSTPGVAFLLTAGVPEGGYPAVTGAFLMAAGLIVLAGVWKPFARAVAAIPAVIANAMLAGVLLPLCIAPLKAVEAMPWQTLPIIAVWALALRYARRYAVPLAVVVTVMVLGLTLRLPEGTFVAAWPTLTPIMPVFTFDAFVRIALPLFVITMASQNLPGLAVMTANGFKLNAAPIFVSTGLASVVTGLFGGHTINLAAITAAICAGPEAHPDPQKRWVAPIAAGVTYLLLALIASLAAAFIAASPPLLIQTVAGLALLTSLASALAAALTREDDRLVGIVTFITAASGITLIGIGAAFWGLIAGLVLMGILKAPSWRLKLATIRDKPAS